MSDFAKGDKGQQQYANAVHVIKNFSSVQFL